jgi:hypothetical protein
VILKGRVPIRFDLSAEPSGGPLRGTFKEIIHRGLHAERPLGGTEGQCKKKQEMTVVRLVATLSVSVKRTQYQMATTRPVRTFIEISVISCESHALSGVVGALSSKTSVISEGLGDAQGMNANERAGEVSR